MKRVFYAVSALFVCLSMSAQINTVTQMDKKVKQYDAVFFEVALTGEWENPYLQEEAALDMILTSPSGKELVLPCFYKSGESGSESIWEARFTPQEKGKYTYFFRYTEDGNTVSESEPAKFKARRGKGQGILHVRDNWTLVYDNGDPFRGVGINLCWASPPATGSPIRSRWREIYFTSLTSNFCQQCGQVIHTLGWLSVLGNPASSGVCSSM